MMGWWISQGGPAAEDLAREDLLLDASAASGIPWLFSYSWAGPALVLGYGQDPASGIDLEACRARGVSVLRRCTGGTGVVHQGDLALSLALPAAHPWARSIPDSYDGFVAAIERGLGTLGIATRRSSKREGARHKRSPICFEDHASETLLMGQKKVLGCAQMRRNRAVLVHGVLLLGLDTGLQAQIYKVPETHIGSLLGHLPKAAVRSPEFLAAHLAQAIAGALIEPAPEATPVPALPAHLLERARDPKWLIVGAAPVERCGAP
jgi:lipoyl(octanoyl) transferase